MLNLLGDNSPKTGERFVNGFKFGFIATFTAVLLLGIFGVVSNFFLMSAGVIVIPLVLGATAGIYFGLLKALKIETKGFFRIKFITIGGFLIIVIVGKYLLQFLDIFSR